jgi:hypothetical protein
MQLQAKAFRKEIFRLAFPANGRSGEKVSNMSASFEQTDERSPTLD